MGVVIESLSFENPAVSENAQNILWLSDFLCSYSLNEMCLILIGWIKRVRFYSKIPRISIIFVYATDSIYI